MYCTHPQPRRQLLNQIGDNLCIFRFAAKLYNLRHLLHYAWKAPFSSAHFFLTDGGAPLRARGRASIAAAAFGSDQSGKSLSFLTLAWRWQMRRSKRLRERRRVKAGLLPRRGPRVRFYPHFSLDL